MKKLILLTMTLSVLLAATALGKDKRKVIKTVEVTATSLRARVGASTKFHALGEFQRDTILPIFEEVDGWYKTICPPTAKLFISPKYIKVKGDKGTIQGNGVNARSRPDAQSVVCMKFNHKTKVTVLGQKSEWIQIAPPADAYAWISGDPKFTKVVKNVGGGNIQIKQDIKIKALKPRDNDPLVADNGGPITIGDITSQPGVTQNNGGNKDAQKLLDEQEQRRAENEAQANKDIAAILLGKEKARMKKGWVRRLGRVIGRKATHAIYFTKGEDKFHLISKNPDIKLEDYANKFVGVLGEDLGKEKRSKVTLISVSKIKVFKEKEKGIKLKSNKKK